MTNPLNNLRKYPRRPFREKALSAVNEKLLRLHNNEIPSFKDLNVSVSDSEFNDLIEDVTSEMVSKNVSKYSNTFLNSSRDNFSRSESTACQPLSKDYDIISKLLERIKNLEMTKRYNEKEIRDKSLRIKVLEEKCNLYKATHDVNDIKYDQLKNIKNKCLQLENQINEMEDFLADYGLIWVGNKSTDTETNIDTSNISTIATTVRNFVVDYDKIIKNIEELNMMVNSEISQIAMTAPQRVQFKKQQAVSMTFYSNGVSLFSGPFRPFSEESTRQIVIDIQDGYFPSELEDKFPSGVPINVNDKRNIFYDVKPVKVFQGVGQTLGGTSTASKLTGQRSSKIDNEKYNQPFTEILTSDLTNQLTMEQFLNKLPQNTITKDGKVLAIRNSIRDIIDNKLTQNNNNVAHIDNTMTSTDSLSSRNDVAQIKIRSLNGDKVFNVVLKKTDLVQDLYRKLNEMWKLNSDDYVLVLSFPSRKKLSDFGQTIEDCGLVPTASLHIEHIANNERHL